jgi:hypothetical protein
MKTVFLFIGLSASSVATAQVNPPDSDANQSTPAPQPVPPQEKTMLKVALFARLEAKNVKKTSWRSSSKQGWRLLTRR